MGNRVSNAFTNIFPSITRAVKNYNFESRAEKAITKSKRPAAPRHSSTADILDKFATEHPELHDAQKIKDENLVERLKQVHVDSKGANIEIQAKRKLPEYTKEVVEPELGFAVPDYIPPGKVTLKQTLEFIIEHNNFPSKYTAEEIGKEYNLDAKKVENVLKHFQTFQMHLSQSSFQTNPKLEKYLHSKPKSEPLLYKLSDTTELPSKKKKSSSNEKSDNTVTGSLLSGKK